MRAACVALGVASCALGAALPACTGDTSAPQAGQPLAGAVEYGGLPRPGALDLAVEGDHVTGSYRMGSRTLFLKADIWPPSADDSGAADWESEPYLVDLQYLDGAGNPLVTDVAGPADASAPWPFPVGGSSFDADERAVAFAMLPSLADALQDEPVADHYRYAMERLCDAATAAAEGLPAEERARALELLRTDQLSFVDTLAAPQTIRMPAPAPAGGIACDCEHSVEIRRKYLWGVAGYQHSAVLLRVYAHTGTNRNILLGTFATSNHGASASSRRMTRHCAKSFRRASNLSLVRDRACDDLTAWGLGSANHLCNDDTYVQYAAVRDDAFPAERPPCTDDIDRLQAPPCD